MTKEEYRDYISIMLDQIEDEKSLQKIYSIVHGMFIDGGREKRLGGAAV